MTTQNQSSRPVTRFGCFAFFSCILLACQMSAGQSGDIDCPGPHSSGVDCPGHDCHTIGESCETENTRLKEYRQDTMLDPGEVLPAGPTYVLVEGSELSFSVNGSGDTDKAIYEREQGVILADCNCEGDDTWVEDTDMEEVVEDPVTHAWSAQGTIVPDPADDSQATYTPPANVIEDTVTVTVSDSGNYYDDADADATEATVYVCALDLQIDGISEDDEDDKGAWVVLNSDDDDQNDTLDHLQPQLSASSENDFTPLTLTFDAPAAVESGTVTLMVAAGSERVRVWEQSGSTLTLLDSPESLKWTVADDREKLSSGVNLFVEGVAYSTAVRDVSIRATSDLDPSFVDEVAATVAGVDLDADSDNNDYNNAPSGTNDEEIYEDDDKGGKWVASTSSDIDADGIIDHADHEGISGAYFVPMIVRIPDAVLASDASITVTYSASDPAAGTESSPAPGSFRVWTKDASSARDASSDFIASGAQVLISNLPVNGSGNVKLFVECVRGSESLDGQEVAIALTIDGESLTLVEESFTDRVHFRCAKTVSVTYSDSMYFSSVWGDDDHYAVRLLAEEDMQGDGFAVTKESMVLGAHVPVAQGPSATPLPVGGGNITARAIIHNADNGFSSPDDHMLRVYLFQPTSDLATVANALQAKPQKVVYLSSHGLAWGGTTTYRIGGAGMENLALERLMRIADYRQHPQAYGAALSQELEEDDLILSTIAANTKEKLIVWSCNTACGPRGEAFLRLFDHLYGREGLEIVAPDDYVFDPYWFDGWYPGNGKFDKPDLLSANDALPVPMPAAATDDAYHTTHQGEYNNLYVTISDGVMTPVGEQDLEDDFAWLLDNE